MKTVSVAVEVSHDELLWWLEESNALPDEGGGARWIVTEAVDELRGSEGFVRLELVVVELTPEEL